MGFGIKAGINEECVSDDVCISSTGQASHVRGALCLPHRRQAAGTNIACQIVVFTA